MFSEAELAIVRRAYAKQVLAAAAISGERLERAFAEVRREHFLGAGPWPILRYAGYVPTPSADPVYLYTNNLVGILPERRLNNGEPSLHAHLIGSAAPREGDHVVHVGAGLGYFTAILAHMAGSSGRVTAVEYDEELARRAAANFAGADTVRVIRGDGTAMAFEAADVVYVNAGATGPKDVWLDALADGGRLVLPLTTDKGFLPDGPFVPAQRRGAVFLIERRGGDFSAKVISPISIFPCVGARDAASEAAVTAAFEGGGQEKVTRLYRHEAVPDERCWLRGAGWCLAYA